MKNLFFHASVGVLLFYSSCIVLTHQREFVFERIDPIPGRNIFVFDSLRVKKFNRSTYVLDGALTIQKDLDNSMDFTAVASNFNGGQYKKYFEKKFNKFCDSLWDPKIEVFYTLDMKPFTNAPEFGSCPWNAGNYWSKNLMVQDSYVFPLYLPGGEQWRIEIRFYEGDEIIAGYDIYFRIVKDLPIG